MAIGKRISVTFAAIDLVAIIFIYCSALSMAQSNTNLGSVRNPLNLTSLPPNKNISQATEQIALSCQVVEEIIKLNTFNSSNFSLSPQKQVQLEAMVIVGNQVMENVCTWLSTVFNKHEVLENGSCSYSRLQDYCQTVKDLSLI